MLTGEILDVAVDIRQGSPTYGKVFSIELSAENKKQLYIPKGFAHGFLSLEDGTEFLYKCSAPYNPASEGGVAWNDPVLAIPWPFAGTTPQLSDRDRRWPLLNELSLDELFP